MTLGPDVRFTGVQRRFGHRIILDKVDARFAPGESIALLGPNGAGKTTLLRMAAGLLRPSRGTVHVGEHVAGSDPARKLVAFTPQDPPLYAELTPLEHLSWWARMHGRDPAGMDLDDRLDEAGIAHQAHRPAGDLSRGQRQRLNLALAWLMDPPVLFLDEPYTALDVDGAAWLDARLEARRGSGITALILHDNERAYHHGDRVLQVKGKQVTEVPL